MMQTALHELRDGKMAEILAAPGQHIDPRDHLMWRFIFAIGW
jgi:hypothetical protein